MKKKVTAIKQNEILEKNKRKEITRAILIAVIVILISLIIILISL